MLRLALLLAVAVAAALFALWGAQSPGVVTIEWLGQRVETSALFALLAIGLALAVLLPVIGFILDAGGRITFRSERARLLKGQHELARALLAFETGESRVAAEHAGAAAKLIDEPILAKFVAALALQAKGEDAALERLYADMLAHGDTELLARKGLLDLALGKGERTAALAHAEAAIKGSTQAAWAALALLELRAQAHDWDGALEAIEAAEKREALSPPALARRKAVLLAAAAAKAERERNLERAVELAVQACRIAPGLAPAAMLAARVLRAQGETWKALGILEEAWAAAPHPALAAAYRDLRAEEPAAERLQRLDGLVRARPEHRESRLLAAELALERQDWSLAWDQLDAAYREFPSSRACGLLATLSRARGEDSNARHWAAQAVTAPREPDWSDLDPEEPAFFYTDAEWRRLLAEFGERGGIVHARLERGLADAPFSAGFVGATAGPARIANEAEPALRAQRVQERTLPGAKAS